MESNLKHVICTRLGCELILFIIFGMELMAVFGLELNFLFLPAKRSIKENKEFKTFVSAVKRGLEKMKGTACFLFV